MLYGSSTRKKKVRKARKVEPITDVSEEAFDLIRRLPPPLTRIIISLAFTTNFQTYIIEWCRTGKIDMILWALSLKLIKPIDLHHANVVAVVAETGRIDWLLQLHEKFHLGATEARRCNNLALHRAVTHGYVDVVRILRTVYGLDATDARSKNNLALRVACMQDSVPIIRELRTGYGLDITDVRSQGSVCIHQAVHRCHVPTVIELRTGFGITTADLLAPPVFITEDEKNHQMELICEFVVGFGMTIEEARLINLVWQ